MSGVNKAIIVGRVGGDPDIKTTQDGREIANFSMATSESWKDKATGEKKEITDWHKVVVFNEGLVQVIKNYVKKGSQLYVEGANKTRKWTDKDGIERHTTEIVLQAFNGTIQLLDSKDNGSSKADAQAEAYSYGAQPSPHNQAKQNGYQPAPELNDEMPF